MTEEYSVKCPKCGNEFTVNYSAWNSLSDPEVGVIFRYGLHTFSCKCPECHTRSRYHVTDSDEVITGSEEEEGGDNES
jgi:hypothetical protein